jgi:hypothetical protein
VGSPPHGRALVSHAHIHLDQAAGPLVGPPEQSPGQDREAQASNLQAAALAGHRGRVRDPALVRVPAVKVLAAKVPEVRAPGPAALASMPALEDPVLHPE